MRGHVLLRPRDIKYQVMCTLAKRVYRLSYVADLPPSRFRDVETEK